MPKAFLVRKRLSANWCPVTPPPSPDDIIPVPENLSIKNDNTSSVYSNISKQVPDRPNCTSYIPGTVLNLKTTNTTNTQSSISSDCSEPCAVDLSTSSKTEISQSSYSPHYASTLSSPLSYSTSESDFDVKG